MIGRRILEARSAATSGLANPTHWAIDMFTGGRSASGQSVSVHGALQHADVWACISLLAGDAGSLPLPVYTGGLGEIRKRVRGTPTANLLAMPMPGKTIGNLTATTVAHLLAWGNAYWAKDWSPKTSLGVQHLYPIHPGRVRVSRDENGEPRYIVTPDAYGGGYGEYSRRDIVHFSGLSLDGLVGMSPIGQTREAIGSAIAAEEYGAAFWANSAHPAGVLESQQELSDSAWKRLQGDWDAMHRGPGNAHRVAILEAGMAWKPVGLPLVDAQFIEQRKFSTAQIARIFRIAPEMIGAESGSSMTYSNVESREVGYLTRSLRPWLKLIEDRLAIDGDLFVPGTYPEYLLDDMLRADSDSRATYYTKAVWRWLTPNEIRRRENEPPIADGDKLYPPANPTLPEVIK